MCTGPFSWGNTEKMDIFVKVWCVKPNLDRQKAWYYHKPICK
jgi:hypothetical protein